MTKKNLALLLLLGCGISLAYAYKYSPRQQRISASTLSAPRTNRAAKNRPLSNPARNQPLRQETPGYAGCHADLFRPLFDIPPEPEPEPKPESKNPAASSQAFPIIHPPPQDPPSPPEPPMIRQLAGFTYLGQLSEGEDRVVFLKGKERIFVVRTGEPFGEKKEFRLLQVTEKEIKIAAGGRHEPIRIPLENKKPLKVDTRALPFARDPKNKPLPPLPEPGGDTL